MNDNKKYIIGYIIGFVFGVILSTLYAILRFNTMTLDYFFTGKC